MSKYICQICHQTYDVAPIVHLRNTHNIVYDSYKPSSRYKSFRARNRLQPTLDEEILGYEPYNNIDAILLGDNKKMLYWSLSGRV